MQRIGGIIPPATTPFTADGAIDFAAAREEVRWLLRQGVHGLAIGGSTGEGHTLEVEEFRRVGFRKDRLSVPQGFCGAA